MAASALERQKETMKQIMAEAEKELEETRRLKEDQKVEENKEEDAGKEEEEEVVEEEQEVEEVRRASVSTVELDDTETHILPSASFLGNMVSSLSFLLPLLLPHNV